jgi:hypothetical protein
MRRRQARREDWRVSAAINAAVASTSALVCLALTTTPALAQPSWLFGPWNYDQCVEKYVVPAKVEMAARLLILGCQYRFQATPPKRDDYEPQALKLLPPGAVLDRPPAGASFGVNDPLAWEVEFGRAQQAYENNLRYAECIFSKAPEAASNAGAQAVAALCQKQREGR